MEWESQERLSTVGQKKPHKKQNNNNKTQKNNNNKTTTPRMLGTCLIWKRGQVSFGGSGPSVGEDCS